MTYSALMGILISLLLGGSVGADGVKPASTQGVAEVNVARDSRFGFEIQYPKTWERAKQDRAGTMTVYPTPTKESDDVPSVLVVAYPVTDLPNVKTTADFKARERALVAGCKVESEEMIKIGENEAYQIVFSTEDPQTHHQLKIYDDALVLGGMVYGVSFNGTPEALEKFMGDFLLVRKSFRVGEGK